MNTGICATVLALLPLIFNSFIWFLGNAFINCQQTVQALIATSLHFTPHELTLFAKAFTAKGIYAQTSDSNTVNN